MCYLKAIKYFISLFFFDHIGNHGLWYNKNQNKNPDKGEKGIFFLFVCFFMSRDFIKVL